MTEQAPPISIQHQAGRRFFAEVNGDVAELTYRLDDGVIRYTHTLVPQPLEGRGIAGLLTRHGLDYARAEGLRVIPDCPYVKGWLKRHPEYQDLVDRPGEG